MLVCTSLLTKWRSATLDSLSVCQLLLESFHESRVLGSLCRLGYTHVYLNYGNSHDLTVLFPGFSDINPSRKESEINSLTDTVLYLTELMSKQTWRMEFEFERECINEMAR